MRAVFQGEGGSDYGGLYREAMTVMGDELMNKIGDVNLLRLFLDSPNNTWAGTSLPPDSLFAPFVIFLAVHDNTHAPALCVQR